MSQTSREEDFRDLVVGGSFAIGGITAQLSGSGTVSIFGDPVEFAAAYPIGGSGITVNDGTVSFNQSLPLVLGASQTWTNNGDFAVNLGGSVATAGNALQFAGGPSSSFLVTGGVSAATAASPCPAAP